MATTKKQREARFFEAGYRAFRRDKGLDEWPRYGGERAKKFYRAGWEQACVDCAGKAMREAQTEQIARQTICLAVVV